MKRYDVENAEMFSDTRVALMKELKRHPELHGILLGLDDQEWPSLVGHIADYCNVGLDGLYTPNELEELYKILLMRLQKMKPNIILTTPLKMRTKGDK